MPRKPTGRPNGRPPKPIKLDEVEKLAAIGCTIQEIASVIGVAASTLTARDGFREAYDRGLDQGKVSLRRAQFRAALAGNSRMLTWMGMQLLGQKNRSANELSGPDGQPIQLQVDLTKLNDAELTQLEQLVAKASEPPAGEGGNSSA